MSKVAVFTDKAPKPRPVYNQAIVANGLVFCSGQLPKDLSGKIVEGTVQDRTVRMSFPMRTTAHDVCQFIPTTAFLLTLDYDSRGVVVEVGKDKILMALPYYSINV